MIQWGKRFSFERRGGRGRRITIWLYWHFVKEFSCELLAAGCQPGPKNHKMDSTKAGNYPTTTATPTFERESFFSLNHILGFILWCIPIPGFPFLVFLELGRQPEVGAQKKNWNFFQNFLKKWWKTYSNTYQHHHRVIWYQGLRIWHRHVRTTITFSYRDHFTFPAF